jgi:ubiquinone/menaquinone biosynthesis C-methylase UbiE
MAICNYLSAFIPADAVVLELGPGYCDFINHIGASKKFAVDINPLSGNYCNKDTEFIQSDVLHVDFQPGSIGIVLASNFFEHFNDQDTGIILDKVNRWLTNNGKLILIQPNYKYAWRDYWDDYTHVRAFSHISLSDLLKSKGFNIVRVEKKFLPFSFKSLLPKSYYLTWLYLKFRIRPFAKQMLIIAEK